MTRTALRALALLAPMLAAATAAAAQANSCDLVSQRGNYSVVGAEGNRLINAQGPLLVRCTNGEELRADSAVLYQSQNEVHLFRQVDYQDPGRSLTSNTAIYNSVTGRLYATGDVVFTDKQQGSTLRGPELEYYRAIPGRPQSQATATQRPHVTVTPKGSSNNGRRRNPLEIDADRVTSVGDRFMTATGSVVINDNGTRSVAEEAYYDQSTDHVELRRRAEVHNEKYQLFGEFISSDLSNGSLSKVLAQTNARLVSDRLTVTGPQLQLFFERDLLQRMVSGRMPGSVTAPAAPPAATPPAPPASAATATPPASGAGTTAAGGPTVKPAAGGAAAPATTAAATATPAPPLPPGERSVALSKGFRLEADSLEALTPAQQLRQVNAVGRARGESWDTLGAVRVLVDTGAAATRPDTATRVVTRPPEAVDQKDVLTADTIIAYFVNPDSARTDSAGPRLAGRPAIAPRDTARGRGTQARGDTARTEIDRLLAIGDAHSLYRTRPDSTKPANEQRPGINYLVGDRIDLRFKAGEVDVAHVRGLKRGLYLDPTSPRDSAAADSAGARPGGRTTPGARPGTTTRNGTTATGARTGTRSSPATSGTKRTTPGTTPAPPAPAPAPPSATTPSRPQALAPWPRATLALSHSRTLAPMRGGAA